MKRLLAPILVIAILAFTASAYATLTVHDGSAFGSQTASGSCWVARTLSTANISCGAGSGTAAVRYGFSVPAGCPSVSPHVDWTGVKPGVAVKTIGSKATVIVRQKAPLRSTSILTVSISYWC
jgi:hypothetical protein